MIMILIMSSLWFSVAYFFSSVCFWVHSIRMVRRFYLNSPTFPTETIYPPHLNSSWMISASITAWFHASHQPLFLHILLTAGCTGKQASLQLGTSAIWMVICNPINTSLIFLQHCFHHVTMLLHGPWWHFLAYRIQSKILSLHCQFWIYPAMLMFSLS